MLTLASTLSLLSAVSSIVAAIFLSRATSRPSSRELRDLGHGMILANYTTSLLFGPRTALVQGAVIQWAEHTVGIWILCLAVAVHALGLVLTSWTAQLPLYLGLVAVAVLALVLRQVGKGFARRHAVRELLTLVRTSLQNVNLQQRTDASASATEKLRAELTEGIARLLDGLVAREKALRLADRMLQSSLK